MKNQIILIALFAIAAVVVAHKSHTAKHKEEFHDFVEQFGREYADESEYNYRFNNFVKNIKKAEKINKKNKLATYGVTKFSDWSEEEIRSMKMKPISADDAVVSCLADNVTSIEAPIISRDPKAVPAAFDWRSKHVVSSVKNQGQCGSCWTFSTAGNIESQWALAGNALMNLSEQMIVDCSHSCVMEDGESVCNSGCGGGWMWTAMTDVISWGGLETEEAYPYTAETGTCQFSNTSTTDKLYGPIKNYTCIGENEDQILLNLLSRGPLSIAMNADILESYTTGIIDPSAWWDDDDGCDPASLDHALLLVGYGSQAGVIEDTPFWTIKNSWGEDWGEEGYFRIIRGYGACGMNEAVTCAGFGNSPFFHTNE